MQLRMIIRVGFMEEEEKDDEISIDLSKIKNFFKRKKESREKGPEIHTEIENKDAEIKPDKENEEDRIIASYSWQHGLPNEGYSAKSEVAAKENLEGKEDKKVPNKFKKTLDFFVQHRILILMLIPILLSIFLRVQPAYLPSTEDFAKDIVIDNLRSQIRAQMEDKYPNAPDQNKEVLTENELQKILKQQKQQIDQQIYANSQAIKSRMQDDTGQTYLLAIDPYFWMRYARNIIQNGHPGDELKDGKPWDNHMFAPVGRIVPFDMFHAYFIAFLFKILSFFNQNINLMTVAFYTPVIISSLSVIPAFFITRKVTGNFGAFIAYFIKNF